MPVTAKLQQVSPLKSWWQLGGGPQPRHSTRDPGRSTPDRHHPPKGFNGPRWAA